MKIEVLNDAGAVAGAAAAVGAARRILWLVTDAEKTAMLARVREGDPAIPAGRIRRDSALVLADRAAAGSCSSACKW